MPRAEADCLQSQPLRPFDQLRIDWMKRGDMPAMLQIEWASFETPWFEEDFVRCLRQRNCIGQVARNSSGRLLGFVIYEVAKTRFQLLNLAVDVTDRRRGVGRQMIDKLKDKLSLGRRPRIKMEVRETNVTAQLFFRALGFRCVNTLRDYYEETSEDAYVFQYRVP
jgi:[ribosomal protein S18]-alanine N-acetyltransferase